MPLAAAMHLDNLDCSVNQVSKETVESWQELKNIGVLGPKMAPEHVVYFGLRDFEYAEEFLLNQLGIMHFKVEEMRNFGIENSVQKAIRQLETADIIFISFDVDSLDCDQISYGTGTPVKSGFSAEEVSALLKLVISTGKVICLEVAEINPLLDNKGNKMAETAFSILAKVEKQITQ
jgi:arginase